MVSSSKRSFSDEFSGARRRRALSASGSAEPPSGDPWGQSPQTPSGFAGGRACCGGGAQSGKEVH
jgi:hypothetical protein